MSTSSAMISGGTDTAFESMVGDLRRSFIGWLKKTESDMIQKRDQLQQARLSLNEEKEATWKQYLTEKEMIEKKLADARRKFEIEVEKEMKAINQEKAETREKIQKAKDALDNHKENERNRMAMEIDRLRTEYELFEEEKARVVNEEMASNDMIELDVGGTIFETSKAPFQNNNSSGLLYNVLSGTHDALLDENGRLFLDKDPEIFRMLLNFIRSSDRLPTPKNDEDSSLLISYAKDLNISFFPFSLVFSLGGFDGDNYLNALEVLDVSSLSWRKCCDLNTARAFAGSAIIESTQRLITYGGQNLMYRALCDTEIYDCLRDIWLPGPALMTPRRNCGGIQLGSRVFAIGGYDGSSILTSVESYDPRVRAWTKAGNLLVPRSSPSVTTYKDQILCIGGTDGNRLNTVEVYEERANRWMEFPNSLTYNKSSSCSGLLVGHVANVGGVDENDMVLSALELYDPFANQWILRKPMQFSRYDFAMTVVSDTLFVGGGQDNIILDSTEFYRPELDEWKLGPPLLSPRYGHSFLHLNL